MKHSAALLPDGKRLHLQHGPIDLIVQAFGAGAEVRKAYRQAIDRFETLLGELVRELSVLRSPCPITEPLQGTVARRMETAVSRHSGCFITPMAAVAGAVADEILEALCCKRCLQKAYVNNGGDISFYLTPGQCFAIGLIDQPCHEVLAAKAQIGFEQPIRGIATSGRHGRSHSLGIADAVTVFAASAADADAAATLIANAVNIADSPGIVRRPACEMTPDSDLGARLVTVEVALLSRSEVEIAVKNGELAAVKMMADGLIAGAAISLQGKSIMVGNDKEQQPGPRLKEYSLEKQVGFLLRQASQRHASIFADQMLAELTPTRFATLAKLFETGPLPQNELGRQTAMDVATIKGVVDRLCERGYTTTRPDPSDGRRLLVELTARGEQTIRQAIPLAIKITEQTLAPLSSQERVTLLRLLTKLI